METTNNRTPFQGQQPTLQTTAERPSAE